MSEPETQEHARRTPSDMANPIPRAIEVVRGPSNTTQVFIDGDLLPYAISADDPIAVEIDKNEAPSVRLTLLAHTVSVVDNLFVDADLDHDCDSEDPA